MDPSSINLDTALKLLNLPRLVGHDPESGEAILASNGRYGAYLKKGTDTRSLDSEDLIFLIDEPAALALFAQPKYGARRTASSIKEFGEDPNSGRPIKVKDGRFGPYVTDGETNATIPRGENPEEIEFDRAVVLLSERRAKGPAVSRAGARKARPASTTTRTIRAKKKS
jgi:DNA topoisomerase-1